MSRICSAPRFFSWPYLLHGRHEAIPRCWTHAAQLDFAPHRTESAHDQDRPSNKRSLREGKGHLASQLQTAIEAGECQQLPEPSTAPGAGHTSHQMRRGREPPSPASLIGRNREDRTPAIRRHFYPPAYTLFIFLVGRASYEEPHHKYYGHKSQFEDQPIGWICHVKSPTSQRSLAEVKK